MQRTIILFFVTFCSYNLMAQHTLFGFREGLGFYSMKDLGHLQELRREASGLPLKTTECYPPTLNYHIETGQYLNAFISKWGIFYAYTSTGARSTVSDYSGRYDLDANLNSHLLGLALEHTFVIPEHWGCGPYLEAGAIYSRLKTLDFFNLVFPVHRTFKTEYDLIAFGGFAESGLLLNYKFKFLIASVRIGYLIDISAGFHEKGNKEMQLYLANERLRPDWDGLRIGLQLDILLVQKNSQAN